MWGGANFTHATNSKNAALLRLECGAMCIQLKTTTSHKRHVVNMTFVECNLPAEMLPSHETFFFSFECEIQCARN